jgi:hypothetical protein
MNTKETLKPKDLAGLPCPILPNLLFYCRQAVFNLARLEQVSDDVIGGDTDMLTALKQEWQDGADAIEDEMEGVIKNCCGADYLGGRDAAIADHGWEEVLYSTASKARSARSKAEDAIRAEAEAKIRSLVL